MPASFVVARNPDPESSLPFLLRIPVDGGIELKAREPWPATARVHCHPLDEGWPRDAEVLETVPVRSCARRGRAVDLVLDRGQRTAPSSCSPSPRRAPRRSADDLLADCRAPRPARTARSPAPAGPATT